MKELIVILTCLTAGAFVYLAFAIQQIYGNKTYLICVTIALLLGVLFRYYGVR